MFIEYSLNNLLITSERTTSRIYINYILVALPFRVWLDLQASVHIDVSGSGIIESMYRTRIPWTLWQCFANSQCPILCQRNYSKAYFSRVSYIANFICRLSAQIYRANLSSDE